METAINLLVTAVSSTTRLAMGITGAIFDCDGTVLDSMKYWNRLVSSIGKLYGKTLDDSSFAGAESETLKDFCKGLHRDYEIGRDPEELYDNILRIVRSFYSDLVVPFDGCRLFCMSSRSREYP